MNPSDFIPELEQKAFSLILSQNFDEAKKIFENSKHKNISKIGSAFLKLINKEFDEAIAILEEIKGKLEIHENGLVLILKGEIEQSLGNYSNAEALFKETINSCNDNKYLEAMALLKLSTLYLGFLQIENGYKLAKKSISISEELLKKDLALYRRDIIENIKAQAELALSSYYLITRGKINEAYLYSAKALAHFTNINNKIGLSSCWNNLAKILVSKQQYDAALEYTLSSYNIRKKLNDETLMIESLVNIGELLEHLNPKESFTYYFRALELSIKNSNIYFQIVSNIGLSTIALKKGDFSFAKKSIEQAEELEKILGVKSKIIKNNLIFLNKGILYLYEEKWDDSRKYLQKAITLAENENLADGYIKAIVNLAELYIIQENFESARELLYNIDFPRFTQLEASNSVLLSILKARLAKVELNYGNGIRFIEKALNISKKSKSPEQIIISKIEFLEIKLDTYSLKFDFNRIKELMLELNSLISEANNFQLIPLVFRLLLIKARILSFILKFDDSKEVMNTAADIVNKKLQSKLFMSEYTKVKEIITNFEESCNDFDDINNKIATQVENKEDIDLVTDKKLDLRLDKDDIYFLVISIDQNGAKTIVSEQLPFDRSTSALLLSTLGVFYGTAIGQGNRRNEGLYGPLPVADFESFSALVYSSTFDDENQIDPREGGKTYTMVIMLYKNNKQRLFYNRDLIQNFFETKIEKEVKKLSDFNINFINSFKKKFMDFITKLS